MIDKLRNFFKRPIPMWSPFLVLLLAAVPPTLHGSLNVPSGGTITDTNQLASSCVGTNASGKYVYNSGACVSTTPSPVASTGIGISGTWPYTIALSPVPIAVANGGTNLASLAGSKCIRSASTTAMSEAGGDCVVLSPSVQQTGSINVSGGVESAVNGFNFWGQGLNALVSLGPTAYNTAGNFFFQQGTSNSIGCFGTAQSCPLNFYTNGIGSSQTASLSSAGVFQNGAASGADGYAYKFGSSVSSGLTEIGSDAGTINGIAGSAAAISNTGITILQAIDTSGNAAFLGNVRYTAPSATCSASSGVPCAFTWSITLSSGSGTTTATVPASSVCVTTPTVNPEQSSTNMISDWVTLATNTLTIHAHDLLSTSSATFTGNGHCL